jgi:carboxypeptidase PM20D1
MKIANLWLFEPLITREMGATPSGAALLHTTIAPTMLQGSPKANVLPQVATARINFRVDPEMTTQELLDHVKASLGDLAVEIEFEDRYEPVPASSISSEGWRAIAALAHDMSGAPVVPSLFVASTDSSRFVGVARDIYRFVPVMVEREELGRMMHGTNERMSLENLGRIVDFYHRLIRMTAG